MPDRRPTIVFLGTHGQHNIGDELLLETFLHRLGPTWSYVINSYDPTSTAALIGDRFDAVYIDTARDRRALLLHLLRARAVVFGGGSILKELYATTGRHRYATLLMILAIVTFTRLVARAPIGMFHVGVGPIRTRTGRFIARQVLRQVDSVSVRDPGSLELCRRIGAASHVRLSADAVFAQSPEWLTGGAPVAVRADRDVLRVALNLNFHIASPANWEHFQTVLASALDRLVEGRRVELHALPMQSRGKEHHDAEVLREFADRLPHLTFHQHEPATHQEVARIIRACDVVVAERFHTVVLAAILGVPVFALAYDVKVVELARLLELDRCTVDITRPIDGGAMTAALGALVEDLGGARARLSAATERLAVSARLESALATDWLRERAT